MATDRTLMLLLTIMVAGNGCASQTGIDQLQLNEIQVIGSHNSYKQAIETNLFAAISANNASLARSLEYGHPSLSEQLDLGLRVLELDVYFDPEGGRYATPLGLRLTTGDSEFDPMGHMKTPGFKVLHAQDIDFRSNCLTFVLCLQELQSWSRNNSGHLPIMVSINAKDDVIDQPEFVRPLSFDTGAWDSLDAEIFSELAGKLILPDEIMGTSKNLKSAVTETGWPTLVSLMNRFLFVLDEPEEKGLRYLSNRSNPILFTNMPEDSPHSAVLIVNDPVRDGERIQDLVQQGYLVRTRADADTLEARSGDSRRRAAAWASGAHFISTDYYRVADQFDSSYIVQLQPMQLSPQADRVTELTDRSFRCNPVSARERCLQLPLRE